MHKEINNNVEELLEDADNNSRNLLIKWKIIAINGRLNVKNKKKLKKKFKNLNLKFNKKLNKLKFQKLNPRKNKKTNQLLLRIEKNKRNNKRKYNQKVKHNKISLLKQPTIFLKSWDKISKNVIDLL
jgi:hypothetical protein